MVNDNFSKLLEIVNRTKQALVGSWDENGAFVDKNILTRKGVLPEGIGFTGLMLLALAFRDEEKVFTVEFRQKLEEIIEATITKLYGWTEKGFSAAPFAKSDSIVFNEEFGYTDTVTWCLSSAILTRYMQRKDAITLSPKTQHCVFEMIARGTKTIFETQREDGTWGFRTDKLSKSSLYFTYSVNATLADFFDYVLNEIELVESETVDENLVQGEDVELLEYLKSELGYDAREKANAVRASLQNWLIKYGLPLVAKVSDCTEMTATERQMLGMWDHSNQAVDGKHYHNLYYAYYLIDMMVTSAVDLRLSEMINDNVAIEQLHKHYESNGLMSKSDLMYFFGDEYTFLGDGCNISKLFTTCIEQAIHSTRTQYICASKTGNAFWDDTTSELPILWEHEQDSINGRAKVLLGQVKGSVSDPTLAPLALRSNINYIFYITNQMDMTVERLFLDICDQAYTLENPEDERNEDCVVNLWDKLFYSLPITERSIEALVDYYDYLCKFEKSTSFNASLPKDKESATKCISVAKSPFELAVEQKIAEYLASAEGKEAIATAIGTGSIDATVPTRANETVTDIGQIIAKIEELSDHIQKMTPIESDADKQEDDKLVEALLMLYNELTLFNTRVNIKKFTKERLTEGDIMHRASALKKRYDDFLYEYMNNDFDDGKNDFTFMYKKIINNI